MRGTPHDTALRSHQAIESQFDVALSFAGHDRDIAHAIALELTKRGYSVFYDDFYKSLLWGKDLTTFLEDIYRNRARYCLILSSKHYPAKKWPTFERQHAQARQLIQREYILVLKLDDTAVPGVPETISYLGFTSVKDVVDLLEEKLRHNSPELLSKRGTLQMLFDLAVELCQTNAVSALSLILKTRISEHQSTPEFRDVLAAYTVRLCEACGNYSWGTLSELSWFLSSHRTVAFEVLMQAYPKGAPGSLAILSRNATPDVLTFLKSVLDSPMDFNFRNVVLNNLKREDLQQLEACLAHMLRDSNRDETLIKTVINLGSQHTISILTDWLRVATPRERTMILQVAAAAKFGGLKHVVKELIEDGCWDDALFSYLGLHMSQPEHRALEGRELKGLYEWLGRETPSGVAERVVVMRRRWSILENELRNHLYEHEIMYRADWPDEDRELADEIDMLNERLELIESVLKDLGGRSSVVKFGWREVEEQLALLGCPVPNSP